MTRFAIPGRELISGRAPERAAARWPSDMRRMPAAVTPGEKAAQALGWFSIGLGLAEVIAPASVAAAVGVRNPTLVRAMGVREILTGIGILSNRHPTGWMWGRVAGDAVDLAILVDAMSGDGDYERAAVATAAVAGVTALDAFTAVDLSRD